MQGRASSPGPAQGRAGHRARQCSCSPFVPCPRRRWVPPAGGWQRDAHLAGMFCFTSLFSPFLGGGKRFAGGMRVLLPEAAAGSPFCGMVQQLAATKATAKGQDRHLSPKRRGTRAPSACLCSQPICLRGHAASEGQEVKAVMHMRRQQEPLLQLLRALEQDLKGSFFHPICRKNLWCRTACQGKGGVPWGRDVLRGGPHLTSAFLHRH